VDEEARPLTTLNLGGLPSPPPLPTVSYADRIAGFFIILGFARLVDFRVENPRFESFSNLNLLLCSTVLSVLGCFRWRRGPRVRMWPQLLLFPDPFALSILALIVSCLIGTGCL